MRNEEIDIRAEEEVKVMIQDSISSLYYHSKTNTPYTGYTGYIQGYGYLAYSNYKQVFVPLVLTDDSCPNRRNEDELKEVLHNANFASSMLSFAATGTGVLQANEFFYVDEAAGTFRSTPKAKDVSQLGLKNAKDMAKSSKSIGKAFSYVNAVIVAGEIANDGFNINTSTDAVVCVIGFVPGIGWAVSGVYGISNAIVTHVTGKSTPEHARDWFFEKYCQFINELGNWMNQLCFPLGGIFLKR